MRNSNPGLKAGAIFFVGVKGFPVIRDKLPFDLVVPNPDENCRRGGIRTHDPYVPNVVRYLTALLSVYY